MENETINEEKTRKLATIRRAGKIEPIEGADRIQKMAVDGWQVVIRKDEFKEGDLLVFFEIDSLFDPETPYVQFLRDVNRPEKPVRLKTIRLKNTLSQGLALPVETVLGSIEVPTAISVSEGTDLTPYLSGLSKYEPPISPQLAGISRGNFPSFLSRTDEERLENCFETVDETFHLPYYASLKLDGSSMTCYLKDDEFGVCSRNINLKETDGNKFWQMARELDIEAKLRATGLNVAIQGELVGEGVQGNKDNFKGNKLFIFNVFDIDSGQYYDYVNMLHFVQITLGLETVPIIEVFNEGLPFKSVAEFKGYATRKSFFNPKAEAEGIVFRPKEVNTRIDRFGRVSFKCINPQFLLKNPEA